MREVITALVVVVVLSAAVGVSSAQTNQSSRAGKPAAAAAAPARKMASHSTAGTVKSVDANTLVLTHGKKDMTFVLNSSTQKEGTVSTGSHVTVRYTMDGKNMVATAISEQPARASASKTTSAKPAAHK